MAAPEGPASTTYYDRPVLKEPVWIWAVPAYFYAGGVAGAAATLGAAASTSGVEELEVLERRCRALAAAGTLAGTALLIHDLGRPERFLNMLRVVRPSSPLNLGSWLLSAATTTAVVAAVAARRPNAIGALGDASEKLAGALGLPLAGYTAVLLSTTAVPVWQEPARSLPVLFVASAANGAASLLELAEAGESERRTVRSFALAARVAELGAALWVERESGRVERVGRPLKSGAAGAMLATAKVATAGALALSLLGRRSRAARVLAGVLGTVGSAATKFGVFYAGRPSTMDPRATFELQRAAGAQVAP
jgi:formate-dependent nitrite reductase membrane component NrfD